MSEPKDLSSALEDVSVSDIDDEHARINNLPPSMIGWHYVVDGQGIRGYFPNERDALFLRLAIINARLNPIV